MTISPPPGLLEGFIQLPPDSTGKQVRAFPVTVYEQQGDGTFSAATAYQQAYVLVNALGDLIGTPQSPLYVRDETVIKAIDELREAILALTTHLADNT